MGVINIPKITIKTLYIHVLVVFIIHRQWFIIVTIKIKFTILLDTLNTMKYYFTKHHSFLFFGYTMSNVRLILQWFSILTNFLCQFIEKTFMPLKQQFHTVCYKSFSSGHKYCINLSLDDSSLWKTFTSYVRRNILLLRVVLFEMINKNLLFFPPFFIFSLITLPLNYVSLDFIYSQPICDQIQTSLDACISLYCDTT